MPLNYHQNLAIASANHNEPLQPPHLCRDLCAASSAPSMINCTQGQGRFDPDPSTVYPLLNRVGGRGNLEFRSSCFRCRGVRSAGRAGARLPEPRQMLTHRLHAIIAVGARAAHGALHKTRQPALNLRTPNMRNPSNSCCWIILNIQMRDDRIRWRCWRICCYMHVCAQRLRVGLVNLIVSTRWGALCAYVNHYAQLVIPPHGRPR